MGTEVERNYREAMVKREIRRFEWQTLYAPAQYREFTVFPSAEGITVYGVNISERKKAQEARRQSEELFYKAFHGNPAALLITCVGNNRFVDVNETCLQLLEFERGEVVGHTSQELGIFPDYSERERVVALLLRQGSIRNVEMQLRTKKGKLLDALFSFETVIINGEKPYLSFILDITEPKRLQRNLEEYSKNLELIVDERTKQLKEKERLAAIGATAGMVGHDIRNPLQAMISDVFLLKEAIDSMSDTESKQESIESLDDIEKNILYINKIVADLQDYYKLLKPEHVNVNLYELLINTIKPLTVASSVEFLFEVDPSLRLMSDPTLISRILTNLAMNAVQAMPNGGKLFIGAYRNREQATIEVTDTGAGISEDVKDKLFSPLFTTKSKGQGLGLAVVKRLVEALNGSIYFESKEGIGTKFTIRLPLNYSSPVDGQTATITTR